MKMKVIYNKPVIAKSLYRNTSFTSNMCLKRKPFDLDGNNLGLGLGIGNKDSMRKTKPKGNSIGKSKGSGNDKWTVSGKGSDSYDKKLQATYNTKVVLPKIEKDGNNQSLSSRRKYYGLTNAITPSITPNVTPSTSVKAYSHSNINVNVNVTTDEQPSIKYPYTASKKTMNHHHNLISNTNVNDSRTISVSLVHSNSNSTNKEKCDTSNRMEFSPSSAVRKNCLKKLYLGNSNTSGINSNFNFNFNISLIKKSKKHPSYFINSSITKPYIEESNHKSPVVNSVHSQATVPTQPIVPRSIVFKACKAKSQPGKDEHKASKINQDAFLVMNSVYNLSDVNIYAVFDGHGQNGHLVSEFVKHYFKNHYEKHPVLSEMKSSEEVYKKLKENKHEIIKSFFSLVEIELLKLQFDVVYSGTTAVVVFQLGNKILTANVGDSRAILIGVGGGDCNVSVIDDTKEEKKFKYKVTVLSNDQKPYMTKERLRIEKAGGRVDKHSEFGIKAGPYRVWFKNEEYPGIAMSRSIGDRAATSLGVISEPEIIEVDTGKMGMPQLYYIILASDGLWEFVDNNQVMGFTQELHEIDPESSGNAEGISMRLVSEAVKAWGKYDIVVDDITVVTAMYTTVKD